MDALQHRPAGDGDAAAVFDATMKMLANDKSMSQDLRKFAAYWRTPQAGVIIQGHAIEGGI